MKKSIIFSVLVCFQFIFSDGFAQSLFEEWRLIKISSEYSESNPNTSEYLYDNAGKLQTINYYYNNNYGKKWDGSAVKDFVYNNQGRITGFTKYDVTGNLQYILDYDQQNRLIYKKISKLKKSAGTEKAGRVTDIVKYSYKGNEIKESRTVPPSEKVADETTYTLNEMGNVIRMERTDMATKKKDKYTSGDFDKRPNPNLFTGAYFYTAIQSKENGKEGHWEGMKAPEKTESDYDATGLVKKTTITEKIDNNITTSKYTYTYAKIKPATKPGLK